jgi:hypothetical protein
VRIALDGTFAVHDGEQTVAPHRLRPASEGWVTVTRASSRDLGGTAGRAATARGARAQRRPARPARRRQDASGHRARREGRRSGYSALFLTLESLMGRLGRARHENRLDRTLQQLTYPRLLIQDELGYLPLSREEASLFFRLLVRRYERGSLIVTSNKSFADWGEVFNDQVLATAILDRLLHQATSLNIKGESYRLREKKKAACSAAVPSPPEEDVTDDS